jgi:Asp-tRNA(Asn)/Glu-tRNA(Gln) amidotransferase A subunit family amidase
MVHPAAFVVAGASAIGAFILKKRKAKKKKSASSSEDAKRGGDDASGSRPPIASSSLARVDPLGAFVERFALPATAKDALEPDRALEGVSFSHKDIFHVRGKVAGFGNPTWRATHDVSTSTARAIALLRDAGASGVGSTHMDELAYSINGENAHYGAPVNPNARGRIPGGSSSGAAVSVCGEATLALGTDSGGSVRVPAACVGVFGFRPTHGSVSAHGVIPFAPSFDTVGWFARDPKTLAAAGSALLSKGAHPTSASDPSSSRLSGGRLPKRMLVLEDAIDACVVEAQCTVASACIALADDFPEGSTTRLNLGKHLLVTCPSLRAVATAEQTESGMDVLRVCFQLLMAGEAWATHGAWYAAHAGVKDAFGQGTRKRMDAASKVAPESLALMKEAREEVRASLGALLDGETIFVMPTTPGPAPKLDAPPEENEAWRRKTLTLTCVCSMTGFPQVTIPMTCDNKGPYALSFIAGAGQDAMLLDAARAWSTSIMNAFPMIVKAEMDRPERRGAATAAPKNAAAAAAPAAAAPAAAPAGEEAKARGNKQFKEGKFENAIASYTEALQRGGNDADAKWQSIVLSNRAMTRLKIGGYEDAEDDCTKALKLDPKNVKAYLRRGAARSVSGNYLESLEDYECALRLEPKNRDAKVEITRMKDILGGANQTPDFDM